MYMYILYVYSHARFLQKNYKKTQKQTHAYKNTHNYINYNYINTHVHACQRF